MADTLSDDGMSEERIRIRAYEIFLRRGGQGGTPESDWLLAREELIKETASASGASLPASSKVRATKAAISPPEPPAPAAPPADATPPKRSVRNVRSNTASRRGR